MFFRGTLYAALGDQHPVALSTAAYELATTTTRNPALVFAATVMGAQFAVQLRVGEVPAGGAQDHQEGRGWLGLAVCLS